MDSKCSFKASSYSESLSKSLPAGKIKYYISATRMLVLILVGGVIIFVSCFLAFQIGTGIIPKPNARMLGVAIGGLLCLFFSVLYGNPIKNEKNVHCDKCGHQLHPGFKFCGECGWKNRANLKMKTIK
jgi:hypothetical protein